MKKINIKIDGEELTIRYTVCQRILGSKRKCQFCPSTAEAVRVVEVDSIESSVSNFLKKELISKASRLIQRIERHGTSYCPNERCFDKLLNRRDELSDKFGAIITDYLLIT